MLQIVIPLAGKATRFQEKGHTFPKPLFEIGNRSMIEVVLGNLARRRRCNTLSSAARNTCRNSIWATCSSCSRPVPA